MISISFGKFRSRTKPPLADEGTTKGGAQFILLHVGTHTGGGGKSKENKGTTSHPARHGRVDRKRGGGETRKRNFKDGPLFIRP